MHERLKTDQKPLSEGIGEVLPVAETKGGKLLKPANAVKVGLMYYFGRNQELWQGLTGEGISDLTPLAAIAYYMNKSFTGEPLNPTEVHHLKDSAEAIIASGSITGTLVLEILDTNKILKRLLGVFVRYQPLFSGSLTMAERDQLEKDLEIELHKDFSLELVGLPDHLLPRKFDNSLYIALAHQKLHESVFETGARLANVSKETAKHIGRNLYTKISNTGRTISTVFRNTSKEVAGYFTPSGAGSYLMDVGENIADVGHFLRDTKPMSRPMGFAIRAGFKNTFRKAFTANHEQIPESYSVEAATGRAAWWTLWTEANAGAQLYFIGKEAFQGSGHLSAAYDRIANNNNIQGAESDLGWGAAHLFSALFASKALRELLLTFSHNHDQAESYKAKKADIQIQVQKAESGLEKDKESIEHRKLKLELLKRQLARQNGGTHQRSANTTGHEPKDP